MAPDTLYALEKFRLAVPELATGRGLLPEKLRAASPEVHSARSALPSPEYEERFNGIADWFFVREGTERHAIEDLPTEEQERVSGEIYDLLLDIEDAVRDRPQSPRA